jgi:hypothetical protein
VSTLGDFVALLVTYKPGFLAFAHGSNLQGTFSALFDCLVPGVFTLLLMPCWSGKSCLEPQGGEADCPGCIAWAAPPTGLVAFSTGKARMPMKQISV